MAHVAGNRSISRTKWEQTLQPSLDLDLIHVNEPPIHTRRRRQLYATSTLADASEAVSAQQFAVALADGADALEAIQKQISGC